MVKGIVMPETSYAIVAYIAYIAYTYNYSTRAWGVPNRSESPTRHENHRQVRWRKTIDLEVSIPTSQVAGYMQHDDRGSSSHIGHIRTPTAHPSIVPQFAPLGC